MSGVSKKTLAVLMIFMSALGILLSLFILFQVWRFRQPVIVKLQSNLNQLTNILQTTDEGLAVIDQVVKNVYTSTLYLDEATNAITLTIQSTNQFIDSAGTFVGEDLITTITNTQTALDSAQASAKIIDNILTTMSRIPLIGINYNPTLPLNTALGAVSTSLDPLQGTLKNFQSNLTTTRTNMQLLNRQISVLDKNIMQINKNLRQAQATIDNYRSQLSSLLSWSEGAKTNLPTWITTTTWILTIIILWLVIIQIGMVLQGFILLSPGHLSQDVP
ncbi:MAG: hypothetical protein WAM09_02800 [Anaerolineales bacterium]